MVLKPSSVDVVVEPATYWYGTQSVVTPVSWMGVWKDTVAAVPSPATLPPDAEPEMLVDRAIEFGRRVDGLIVTNVITVDQLRLIDQAGVARVVYG